MLPEVFLKALTIARNLGAGRPTHFLAADFDMQRHYRPRMNVVQRPTRAGGEGYLLTGHHELLLPLLVWGVLEKLGEAWTGPPARLTPPAAPRSSPGPELPCSAR